MAQSSISVKAGPIASAKPINAPALLSVLILFFFVFVAFIAVYLQKAPAAVSIAAPLNAFSSGRAMEDLKVIGVSPHPIGASNHAAVCQYIFQRLGALGLEPQVQTTTAVNDSYFRAGTVNNVLARLKGTGGAKALVLSAHYDSVPFGPGASDDGAGVVTLLETARALKAGEQLKNDVIFLFTDGEEFGLLGAQAFANEHPWAKDVGLVLNFEARGNYGPSIMFETSKDNAWLVDQFARAAPYPVSNSFAYEVYRLLPNDTDLTVFKKAGWPGLNFAYINGLTQYHTQLDNLQNIDERSLQHHGSYALALARDFGNLDLTCRAQGNAVYFNILGTTLLHYSYGWNIPLAIVALILTVAVLVFGVRKGELTIRGVAWGILTFVTAMLLVWLAVTIVWWLINFLANRGGSVFQNNAYESRYYILSFLGLAGALFAILVKWSAKRTGDANLFAGVLVCFAILLVPGTLFLPGASYLLLWPLLSGVIALLVAFVTEKATPSPMRLGVLALGVLPGLLLLVPTIYFLYSALVLSMPAVLVVAALLPLGLLTPFLALPASSKKWWLPGAFALASLIFIVLAALNSGFDNNRPQRSDLLYAFNSDTGKAIWASGDARPNGWTAQFLAHANRGDIADFIPSRNRTFLRSDAPAIQMAAPNLTVLKDETGDGVRRVKLRISSPRQAPNLWLFIDAEVLKAQVNGRDFMNTAGARIAPGSGYSWAMQYAGVPTEGVDLALELKPSQPFKITVVDRTDGLPDSLRSSFKSRPPNLIPSSNQYSDASFVTRRFTL